MSAPNCYECKFQAPVPGDAHIACNHPKAKLTGHETILMLATGQPPRRIVKELGVHGNAHGIRHGWFNWPVSFDPVWLVACKGFEPLTKENCEEERK